MCYYKINVTFALLNSNNKNSDGTTSLVFVEVYVVQLFVE